MTVTFELPENIEEAYAQEARQRGVTPDEVMRDVLVKWRPEPFVQLEPEEWVRKFEEWAESHRDLNLPVLSDEAMSRESIYEDRGL